MKLDYDCVRDVLFALEDLCGFDDEKTGFRKLTVYDISEYITEYETEEVFYTLMKLKEAEYIQTIEMFDTMNIIGCLIIDITFQGHQYLNSIRDDKIWASIKKLSSSLTFSIILKIAESIIMKQINL